MLEAGEMSVSNCSVMGNHHPQSARAESKQSYLFLGNNVFAHGMAFMAYVALTRVMSLEGVCVVGLIRTELQKPTLRPCCIRPFGI